MIEQIGAASVLRERGGTAQNHYQKNSMA